MARPPEHSVPPSQPAPFRHLGSGSMGGRGDRPLRVQLIVALVAGLILVAVPLYLWRRPKPVAGEATDGGTEAGSIDAANAMDSATMQMNAVLDGGSFSNHDIKLEKVRIDSCHRRGPGKVTPDQCDRQPFFEEALVKAVLENVACAPKLPSGGTLSFALKVHYDKKSTSLYPGRSGSIRRPRANPLIECVSRALPSPNWDSLPHQFTTYVIALQATYPPSEKAGDRASPKN